HQNVVLKLELCVNFLEREGADFLEYGYSCYSGEESEDKKTAYYELRQNMMQQLITYVDKKQGYRLEQKKILYSIISCLYKYFRQEKFILPQRCNETRIVFEAQHYINKNYD
ncbi:MAG TPA: hypothetical protein PLU43_08740, partial [Lachnospiraceae bacterium]|nr:hypothetical protein [Lachnospiraceae bacterium]